MTLLFDIEGNGLLDDVSVVHCGVTHNVETGERRQFRPHQIPELLDTLAQADCIVAHNAYGYDVPALAKVYDWSYSGRVVDTDPWSRLADSDLQKTDFRSGRGHLAGNYTLKAWGERLGVVKGDYGEQEEAWDEFSEDMLSYCDHDVTVLLHLFNYLTSQEVPHEVLDLEMNYVAITESMTQHGVRFDVGRAEKLFKVLDTRCTLIQTDINEIVPPKVIEMKTPQYWCLTHRGVARKYPTKGEAEKWRKKNGIRPRDVELSPGPMRVKEEPFNVGSRKQVRDYLWETHQWVSPTLSDAGMKAEKADKSRSRESLAREYGSLSEDVLQVLDFPLAKKANEYLILDKRRGMVRGWLDNLKEGRLHHRYITVGCATHRASHSSPNLGQVPSLLTDKEGHPIRGLPGRYGAECRELFLPDDGDILIGCDLSGIEARVLAHFLSPYDGGEFAEKVFEGDIHQDNADAVTEEFHGVAEIRRKYVKNVFYGYLYGAGNFKLGLTASTNEPSVQEMHGLIEEHLRSKHMDASERNREAYVTIGQCCVRGLEKSIQGLGPLVKDVQRAARRGFLRPLDGRRIPIRGEHAALNSLIQGSSAIVFRKWVQLLHDATRHLRRQILLCVHDEVQTSVHPEDQEEYSALALSTIKESGRALGISVPLDGETKVGMNWMETH